MVTLSTGAWLRIRGEALAVTVRPWDRRLVAATAHDHELPAPEVTYVSVDAVQNGIGTASCGQGVQEQYRLRPTAARLRVVLDGSIETA